MDDNTKEDTHQADGTEEDTHQAENTEEETHQSPIQSPPSWEHLDNLSDDEDKDDPDTDGKLSQTKECVSRSPGHSAQVKLANPARARELYNANASKSLEEVDISSPGILNFESGERFTVENVDTFKDYAPQKFCKLGNKFDVDRSCYDGLGTLSDTRLLWRVSAEVGDPNVNIGQRLRTPSDRDSESVYDTVSSTSSSTPLLRKCTQDPNGKGDLDLIKALNSENSGKNILAKTLEQVKKSLEDLAPSPEAEMFSQVMGAPSVYKLSRVYLKNLVILSLCFMTLYTAFFSLRNLQSSINQKSGLGLAGLACISASFIVFCVSAPSIVHKVRPKYALVISMMGHLVFEFANFYPSFYTIIPSTLLLGCSMSCLWVAQGTYLTSVAVTYATVTGKKHDAIIGLFNGIFLFCLQLAQIIGNLLSSFVFNISMWNNQTKEPENLHHLEKSLLHPDLQKESTVRFTNEFGYKLETPHNHSVMPEPGTACGTYYCHVNIISQDKLHVDQDTMHILLGIFISLTILAIFIMSVFLDKLDVIFHRNKSNMKQQLMTLINLHRDHKIWLLSMLLVFLGMEQAYMFGEVTKAFITCPLGVHMIGYVMVCFGACDSLMSFICGQLQKSGSTRVLMSIGAVAHLALLGTALLWQPDASHVYLVFVFAGCLGIADAIWQTQICCLIGMIYPQDREAAFASLRMYEGIGYTVAFAYAQYLCMDVKTYILIGVLVVAMINYHVMEVLTARQRRLEGSYPPVDV